MFGQDKNKTAHPLRYKILTKWCILWDWIVLTAWGMVSCKLERKNVDYTEWLGPDWKPKYEGAGLYVANHTSFFEICSNIFMMKPTPAYVTKESALNLPGVGFMIQNMQCVFVRNENTKENRLETVR